MEPLIDANVRELFRTRTRRTQRIFVFSQEKTQKRFNHGFHGLHGFGPEEED